MTIDLKTTENTFVHERTLTNVPYPQKITKSYEGELI